MELNNEFKSSIKPYTNEKKMQLKNLLDDLVELTKEEPHLFDIDNRKRLINWLRDLNNKQLENNSNVS